LKGGGGATGKPRQVLKKFEGRGKHVRGMSKDGTMGRDDLEKEVPTRPQWASQEDRRSFPAWKSLLKKRRRPGRVTQKDLHFTRPLSSETGKRQKRGPWGTQGRKKVQGQNDFSLLARETAKLLGRSRAWAGE